MSGLTECLRRARRGWCAAVAVAAGASERMGEDKLFLELDGISILGRSLLALEQSPVIDEIVAVTRPEKLEAAAALRDRHHLTKLRLVVPGGATRGESALNGVMAVSKKAKIICIHDAARPFVTGAVIAGAVEAAASWGGAAPALPLKDTVKRARRGVVVETPDRSSLFAVQTPQAFRAELIRAALQRAAEQGKNYTDDCAAAEAIGCSVYLSPGDEDNIKLTTPADLVLARAILEKRRAAP